MWSQVRQMAEDPVAEIARAASRRLVPEFGTRVETDVEEALYAWDNGERHQYDLAAVGALIVSIAQLAWTIYADHRKKTPNAASDVTERVLRTELRHEVEKTPASLKITEVVVQEIVSAADQRRA